MRHQGQAKQGKVLNAMPMISVAPSLFCNLQCPYCPKTENLLIKPNDDLLLSESFLDKIAGLADVHFVLGGGEPLFNTRGIKKLIGIAIEKGHVLSFYSNLSMPQKFLAEVFNAAPLHVFGEIIATQHLHSNIDEQQFIENVLFLHDKKINVNVRWLVIPEDLDTICRGFDFWRGKGVQTSVMPMRNTNWNGRFFPVDYTTEELKIILPMVNTMYDALNFFDGMESENLLCRAGNDSLALNLRGNQKVIPCCLGEDHPVEWEKSFFCTGVKQPAPCRMKFCCLYNQIESVTRIIGDYESLQKPGANRYPTITDIVTVARKIETETGRRFYHWPPLLEQTARELGLGMADDHLLDAEKKGIFVLPEGECLSKLEVRSCGGTPVLATNAGHITMQTFSAIDSLRTPFFVLPESNSERTEIVVSFESVDLQTGDFSWRIVVQNYQLKTLLKKNIRASAKSGESIDTINLPLSYLGKDKTIRLIFAPIGTVGSTFSLGKAIRVYFCNAGR